MCNLHVAMSSMGGLTHMFSCAASGRIAADAGVEDGKYGCRDIAIRDVIHVGGWRNLDLYCTAAVRCFYVRD